MLTERKSGETSADPGVSLVDSVLDERVLANAAPLVDLAFNQLTTAAIFSQIPVLDLVYKAYDGITAVQNNPPV